MLALAPRLRRPTAFVLTLGLLMTASTGLIMAGTPSTFTGRVLAANGADPRAGVVVTLVDPASETTYKSTPTDAKGAFSIASAPAGSYALVVEAPEGAFLASSNLQIAPGVNRPVALALKPGKQGTPPPAAAPAGAQPPPKKGAIPTWAKWVIAGGIVVGAAIVVDAVTSSSNEASSF
jgi:carboxypeptidase family protein